MTLKFSLNVKIVIAAKHVLTKGWIFSPNVNVDITVSIRDFYSTCEVFNLIAKYKTLIKLNAILVDPFKSPRAHSII